VNRIWKKLLGRGLVEPEDQIHAENPATHPELFTFLADDFAQNQFDLKRLIAGIVRSETYQRSSIGENDTQYGVATLKPLTPEQLLVSLTIATGYDAVIKSKSKLKTPGMLEVRLELEREFTLFTEKYESASPQFEATTSQALFMTYNQASQKYLKPFVGGLITELLKLSDNGSIVDRAYLAILSRRPSSDERQEMMRYLDLMKPQREARVRDLVWALLNSAEFRFNH